MVTLVVGLLRGAVLDALYSFFGGAGVYLYLICYCLTKHVRLLLLPDEFSGGLSNELMSSIILLGALAVGAWLVILQMIVVRMSRAIGLAFKVGYSQLVLAWIGTY